MIAKMKEKAKTLRGNELGWILKLAENHYNSEQFRKYIEKHKLEKVDNFLKLLMCNFHPNNFDAGCSDTVWLLIRVEEPEEVKQK